MQSLRGTPEVKLLRYRYERPRLIQCEHYAPSVDTNCRFIPQEYRFIHFEA